MKPTVVVIEDKGRLFQGTYTAGMYIDLGFAGKQAIEVISVGGHSKLRQKAGVLTRREKARLVEAEMRAWITYMDDPNDDGNWDGWYQTYVENSR